jgi:hypothetical protein
MGSVLTTVLCPFLFLIEMKRKSTEELEYSTMRAVLLSIFVSLCCATLSDKHHVCYNIPCCPYLLEDNAQDERD